MLKIDDYRKKIDAIDAKILKLLELRGETAQKIGKIKLKDGNSIYVPSRETAIFKRLRDLNQGPYSDEAVNAIYSEIISATRALESPIRVSYLGPEATFTHMAAQKQFGSSASMNAAPTIAVVFDSVERGVSDVGVVPIENSTEGVVNHTLDMFVNSKLKVCAEVVLRVKQNLMAQPGLNLKDIKEVYSHPQALAQCRHWLSDHLAHATLKEAESTSQAAIMALNNPDSAAIASEIAAKLNGLQIITKGIQDQAQNFTRFLVISLSDSKTKTGHDKTSLLFSIKDEAGGLYQVLAPFSKAKINLTKIESRPSKSKAWEYLFFVDCDGHFSEKKLAQALKQVEKYCSVFQILGSYPKSRIYS